MGTLRQLRRRMTAHHRAVLTALRDGAAVRWDDNTSAASTAHIRKQVLATLETWGATQDGRITTIGLRLLDTE